MTKFKIDIKKETFYINEGNSVIGDICFSVDDDWFFPEKDWDDFVVKLVYWLAHISIELAFDKNKIVEMDFMEGCFKISLSLDNQNQCTILFIEGEKLSGDEEVIHKTIALPFEDLKSEVKKACELLIRTKESKELDFEDDYEELKESYDLLCKC